MVSTHGAMARKHVKVEPARWYYWCDKLGLLVWQDMPNVSDYDRRNGPAYQRDERTDIEHFSQSSLQFELELKRIIDAYHNYPSIVMWVPFNEGWGIFLIKGYR